MEIRYASSNKDAKKYDTNRLREEYLIQELFKPNKLKLVYSHFDRIIVGGVCPTTETLKLIGSKELGSNFFLERRELGIINTLLGFAASFIPFGTFVFKAKALA